MFWIKTLYSNNQKKKIRQEFLWRVIKEESSDLVGSLTSLRFLADATKNNKIRIQAFNVPKTHSDFVRDLIELDPKNSYPYEKYISLSELCRSSLDLLNHLKREFINKSEEQKSDRLKSAIIEQIVVLRMDIMNLAESELFIIKIIAAENISYLERIRNFNPTSYFLKEAIQNGKDYGKININYRQGDVERMEKLLGNAKKEIQSNKTLA